VKAIQAPFRSGMDLEDYQLDPVARAVQMPRANLLPRLITSIDSISRS
jgi:hypothetical protein